MNKIPKKIHLLSKTKEIPQTYKRFIRQMFDLHPDWEFYLYDDDQMELIIKSDFPYLLSIYNAFPCNIQRVDFFRVIIVYLIGGFYLDLDMFCLKSLDSLCDNSLVLGVERICSKEECEMLNLIQPTQIANYMFGSMPKHPFLVDIIIGMITNSDHPVRNENDVLMTTGPALLSNTYHTNKEKYNDILVLYNPTKLCFRWCQRYSCHFGDYAAHYHLGSWRWEHNESIRIELHHITKQMQNRAINTLKSKTNPTFFKRKLFSFALPFSTKK